MKITRLITYIVSLTLVGIVTCDLRNNDKGNTGHKTYIERLAKLVRTGRGSTGVPGSIRNHYGVDVIEKGPLSSLWVAAAESLCSNHTTLAEEAVKAGETWAIQVFDSFGKEPIGMATNPTLNWVGAYDECLGVEPVAYRNPDNKTGPYTPFQTVYSRVTFDAKPLVPGSKDPIWMTVGFCLPNSCNETDVMAIAKAIASSTFTFPFNMLSPVAAELIVRDLELTGKAKAVIAVCAVFAAIIVIGTAYDIIIVLFLSDSSPKADIVEKEKTKRSGYGGTANGGPSADSSTRNPLYNRQADDKTPLLDNLDDLVQSASQANATSHHVHDVGRLPDNVQPPQKQSKSKYNPGIVGRLFLAFSAYTNGAKLLATSQPPGVITSVHGIRFITMTWVILGHTFVFGENNARNWSSTYVITLLKRFTYQVIANETVAVDTFFVLSGLLVAFLTLKEMKKKKGPRHFNWFMFYFHRFWRLTPPYMLILMVYVPLIKYWGDGPLWSQTGVEKDECKDTWWRNMLYINNLYDTDKMCMGWSWYLANDMQFYIISPFILIPFFYSGVAGSVLCFVLVLQNLITTGVISKHYNFSASIKIDPPPSTGDSFAKIYVKPYTRVAPYAIGLFAGYLLYKTNCTIRAINADRRRLYRIVNVLGWAVATTFALLVIYGPYTSDAKYKMTETESAFYNAAFRTGWGLAIAWVVCACATGYGGPVNALLSWPALIPPSRLTYVAYLIHPVVMDVYYMSQRSLIYWFDLEIIYEFLGHLCMSYGVAFVVSLAFESPMMALEKVLLGRDKRS